MDAIKEVVQQKYGEAAMQARGGRKAGCGCGTSCCASRPDHVESLRRGQAAAIPAEAMLASLGCGNPTALAELKPGEVVLDLGSGGGIDVLLSAKRVGPTGKAYGLDMTDEMLALARENQVKSGLTNVEFLKGEIEHIPLPDNSVDVIISNCVINLSADKDRVIAEAFRVLKPGGRFAVSDVVVRGEDIPAADAPKHGALGGVCRGRTRREQLPGQVGEGGIRQYRRGTDPCLPCRRCAALSRRRRPLGCRHRCADRRPLHERICPRAKAWRREGLLRSNMLLVNLGVVLHSGPSKMFELPTVCRSSTLLPPLRRAAIA